MTEDIRPKEEIPEESQPVTEATVEVPTEPSGKYPADLTIFRAFANSRPNKSIQWLLYGYRNRKTASFIPGPPSQPSNVRAEVYPRKTPSRSQSIELTWDQPHDNPPDEYIIEMRPKGTDKWIERAISTAPDRKMTLTTHKMNEYTDYEFRITARNKAGQSKPSESSNSIKLGEI